MLFAGAGFSRDARNGFGEAIPLSKELAKTIWVWLGVEGDYDGTELPDVFEAALSSRKSTKELEELLSEQLTCDEIPDYYNVLPKVFWYKIYTTNIDDLIRQVYRRSSSTRPLVIKYPEGEPRDRDQALRSVQLIHLNGKLPCRAEELIFSVSQHGRQANRLNPLYEQFVRDYGILPTIFIGSELNEGLLWKYIEERAERVRSESEHRLKSFLIAPEISPIKALQLHKYNVHPVRATVREFLSWLQGHVSELPDREELLRVVAPDIAAAIAISVDNDRQRVALVNFATSFNRVPVTPIDPRQYKSDYLMGATPKWEDLLAGRDAPRGITREIQKEFELAITGSSFGRVFAILGPAGSGKSTLLRRIGLNLALSGYDVYLTNSEEVPEAHELARALSTFRNRVILLFDNSEVALGYIPMIVETTKSLEHPPLIAIASRTNDFDRKSGHLYQQTKVREIEMPDLNRDEIIEVIRVLEEANLLGALRGMPQNARIREFERKAKKQILVAMREATSGSGFDKIIKDELTKLEPREAKTLYVCVALVTDSGYRMSIQDFLGASRVGSSTALSILRRNLRGMVITSGGIRQDLLMVRHRKIAEYVVDQAAPRALLAEAYIRVFTALATEIGGARRHSRAANLFRDLMNHQDIYRRFSHEVDQARYVYDAIASTLGDNFHYWLQYGSLELEAGNLDYAENYLNQAESLSPGSLFVKHQRGHLYLKRAVEASGKSEAVLFRDRGSQLLLDTIDSSEVDDVYCYHIYGLQRFTWLRKWIRDDDEKKIELEHLLAIVRRGRAAYPRNKKLPPLEDDLMREYLRLAT